MPSPVSALTTLRPDLGASFTEFDLAASRMGFIGYQVMKPFTTMQQSGPFGKIPVEQLLSIQDVKRAASGRYNRDEWEFETDSFATREFGLEGAVDQREANMYANYFDAEVITANRVRDRVLRAAEIRVAALLTATATFEDAAAGTAWTTLATADPLANVEARVQHIRDTIGLRANVLVLPWKAWRALRRTAQWKDFVASSGAGDSTLVGRATMQMAREFFDIENVFVADGQQNSANPGQHAPTFAEIWPATIACVGVMATSNDIQEPCVGRTFSWQEDGGMTNGTVESYEEPQTRGDVIRVRHDVQEKLLYPLAWELITGVTA